MNKEAVWRRESGVWSPTTKICGHQRFALLRREEERRVPFLSPIQIELHKERVHA
jgi:hypothetical protein